jgi:transposase-like protein
MKDKIKYTPVFKSAIVLETLKNKNNIKSIAKQNEISVQLIYKWTKYFSDNAYRIFEIKSNKIKSVKDIM